MKNFNRGSKNGRDGGRRNDFSGGESRREKPKMHQVVCSECGVRCQVPFKPTGERPLYCSECFESRAEGGDNRRKFDKKKTTSRNEECGCCEKINQEQVKHYDICSKQMGEVIERLDKIIGILKESKREVALKEAVKVAKKEVQKEEPGKKDKKKAVEKGAVKKAKKVKEEKSTKKKKEVKKK